MSSLQQWTMSTTARDDKDIAGQIIADNENGGKITMADNDNG